MEIQVVWALLLYREWKRHSTTGLVLAFFFPVLFGYAFLALLLALVRVSSLVF